MMSTIDRSQSNRSQSHVSGKAGQGGIEPQRSAFVAGLWGLWAVVFSLAVAAHLCYGYELDELMHLHTAWAIGRGALPYRDFFENHVPLFHLLLAPLVASQTAATLPCLLLCRAAAALIALLCMRLCALLVGHAHSLAPVVGVGALLLIHPFATVGLEIRPDWCALACVLGALLLLSSEAVKPLSERLPLAVSPRRFALRAVVAGLLSGIAAGMTQKAGFPVPWSYGAEPRRLWRQHCRHGGSARPSPWAWCWACWPPSAFCAATTSATERTISLLTP